MSESNALDICVVSDIARKSRSHPSTTWLVCHVIFSPVRSLAGMCYPMSKPKRSCEVTIRSQVIRVRIANIFRRPIRCRYSSVIYTCAVPDLSQMPYAVSMTKSRCTRHPANHLVVVLPSSSPTVSNFAVCMTPLNYKFDRYLQLVEVRIRCSRVFVHAHCDKATTDVMSFLRSQYPEKWPIVCCHVTDPPRHCLSTFAHAWQHFAVRMHE